jgi:hypothetical protein
MIEYSENVTLVILTCYSCGTPFPIEPNRNRALLDTGDEFYCPNGHGQVYRNSAKKRMELLLQQVKDLEVDKKFYKEEAEYKARQLSATKGVLTRTKNRIAKGICPCCKRSFVQLQKHMEGQHPEYLMESKDD